jgi:DNA-binding transcriptional LysR family regulator
MHLKSLKVYCDVITCGSFSRAASENGMSQSAVSQIVGQLEENLGEGVKLIDRSKRPFVVTREGETFFHGCKKLLARFEMLEEQVRFMHNDVTGRVSIAAIYSIGLHQLNQRVQAFLKQNPQANVRLEYQHPDQVIELVEQDRVDIGMISYPKSTRTLKATLLQNEPMLLVCAPTHRFAHRESLPISELHGTDFVGFNEGLRIRRELDRAFAQENVEPRHTMEFDNIETIKRAVEIDAGVSLLPAPTVQRELVLKTLVTLPLQGINWTRPIGMIVRQGNPLGNTAQSFIRLLEESWLSIDTLTGNGIPRTKMGVAAPCAEGDGDQPSEASADAAGVSKKKSMASNGNLPAGETIVNPAAVDSRSKPSGRESA